MAIISKELGPNCEKVSIYEKELLVVVFAVQKFEQYLLGRAFIIRTQKVMKHLFD